ncbi:MAG: lysophospholipid acyltransferase family protein [Hyphomicrobiaceae bacterium]
MLARVLKVLFFGLLVKPVVLVVIGLNITRRKSLPRTGPAIIAANHNSHLDTMVLMSLFPLTMIHRVRPVAAADYFLATPARSWFVRNVIGIIPLERQVARDVATGAVKDPFAEPVRALQRGDIIIIYPEGTRGAPETRKELKAGVARLVSQARSVWVTPVYLHGLGKALPKGSWIPVPFFCDVLVGKRFRWPGSRLGVMERLSGSFDELAAEGRFEPWE